MGLTVAAWPTAAPSPASKKMTAKKTASKAASKKPTMVHDPVLECRHALYKQYESACQNKTAASQLLTAVEKCQMYGVGTPDWPIDEQWPLAQERIAALKAKGYNLQKARRCLTSAFWEAHKVELEKCGQTPRDLMRQQREQQLPPRLLPMKASTFKPMKVSTFKPMASATAVKKQSSRVKALPFFTVSQPKLASRMK